MSLVQVDDVVWKVTEVSPLVPRPFWTDEAEGLRLYNGDALALLRQSKAERFDVVFADPPYFLSNGGITCQNGQMVSVNKGDWDKAPASASPST